MLNCVRGKFLKLTCSRFNSSISATNNLVSLLSTMSKDIGKNVPSKTTVRKLKNKATKFTPSKVSLSILGSGANGAPKSLYMFSDQARYLFNCGEGTQRLAHEHKMKLAKLEHIFITQATWKNIGGLPGLALTIQDVGVPQITLHGTNGLVELFKATQKFVVMKTLNVSMAKCNENMYSDNVMSVKYVPLEEESDLHGNCGLSNFKEANGSGEDSQKKPRKRRHSESENVHLLMEDNTDYYAYEHKINKTKESKNIDKEDKGIIETKNKGIVMCYICQLTPRPGSLNLDKCVKFGVPPGPLFAQLKSGNEIELPNGVKVKPLDVCEPEDPGPIFLVVDCPSESYLNSFLSNEMLKEQPRNSENPTSLVVHFSPPNIIENSRYKEWMNSFPESTRHLILNQSNQCTGSIAVHRIQHKLNLISKENFPLLKENTNSTGTSDRIIYPRTGSTFHLRPLSGFDNSNEIKIIPQEYMDECFKTEGLLEEISDLQIALKNKLGDLEIKPYPRILFLGTGSCIPNKTRNTSGILFQASEGNNILIDCGEGTHGQLVRYFGDGFREVVANISAIYISHLHADHHIGLIELLQGRQKARRDLNLEPKPVYLLAPFQIKSWLYFYDYYFEEINNLYDLVPNNELILKNHSIPKEREEILLRTLKMADISTCFVKHCPNAFGVAFTDDMGKKITYSGDTMPCENLINLGTNSDLLIHEATMEDELEDEAAYKMHSTTTQAIIIGQRMNAKYTILTHFSQRYAKLPRLNSSFGNNIGIAFDNMMVKLDELSIVPLFNNALKLMFAEHYEELEMKSAKRQLKIEKQKLALNTSKK